MYPKTAAGEINAGTSYVEQVFASYTKLLGEPANLRELRVLEEISRTRERVPHARFPPVAPSETRPTRESTAKRQHTVVAPTDRRLRARVRVAPATEPPAQREAPAVPQNYLLCSHSG